MTRGFSLVAMAMLAMTLGTNGRLAAQQSGSPLTKVSTAKAGAEPNDLRFIDYEERLNALLKTRRDEEKLFVAQVIMKVKNGELPERLIETSYKWVMNKRPDTDYPFIYFERVLRIQAALLKIPLPEFDYEIYEKRVLRAGSK